MHYALSAWLRVMGNQVEVWKYNGRSGFLKYSYVISVLQNSLPISRMNNSRA